MTLGERIYTMRTARNLSQIDLANALDVSRQSVSKWETDASVPELDKLVRMCELFGITMDELVRGETGTRENVPEQAVSEVPVSTRKKKSKASIIVGIVLLCLAALTVLPLLALMSSNYWTAVLSAWFALLTAGIVCLSVRSRAALWALWGGAFVYHLVGTVCSVIVQVRMFDILPLSALSPNLADLGSKILLLIVTVLLIRNRK